MAWNKLSLSTLSTCFKKSEYVYLNSAIIIAIIATFFANMKYFLDKLFHFGSPGFYTYTNLYSIAPNTGLESASDFWTVLFRQVSESN